MSIENTGNAKSITSNKLLDSISKHFTFASSNIYNCRSLGREGSIGTYPTPDFKIDKIPKSESLKNTFERVMPYYKENINCCAEGIIWNYNNGIIL